MTSKNTYQYFSVGLPMLSLITNRRATNQIQQPQPKEIINTIVSVWLLQQF